MTLHVFDGFEFMPNLRNGMSVSSGTLSSITGRDGIGKAAKGSGGSSARLSVPVPNVATVIFGCGYKLTTLSLGTGDGHCFTIYGDAGATEHLNIKPASDGKVTVVRGSTTGTILATSTLVVPSSAGGTWGFWEVKANISDTVGAVIVKINGVEYINISGVDTKNSGTATSVSTISLPVGSNGGGVDDLYVCDAVGSAPYNDFLGDRVVRAVRPDGNGASSQWVGSDGNSTDNYLLVDDDPWSTADYVASATPTQRDLYDFAALSGMATIDAVQVVTQSSKSDAGARSLKTVMRNSGGTILSSADLPLSTTYGAVQGAISLTDAAATAWTQAKVNSHQFGIEVV